MTEIIQRSPEWFAARCGKVTASRVADIIAKTKTGYSTSRDNYLAQLICERMTGKPAESYSNAAMQWGTDTEPFARAAYEARMDLLVTEVGFIDHPWIAEISSTLDTTFGTKQGLENQHVNAGCPMFVPAQPIALAENTIGRQPQNGGNGDGFTDGGPMYTLNATGVHGVAQPIPFDTTQITSKANYSKPQSGDPCHPLAAGAHPPAIAQPMAYNISPGKGALKEDIHITDADATKTLDASASNPAMHQGGTAILQAMAVRRLTPKECERLQGFPDNYTDIQPKGKPTPDGPRYKALGNSMAVPVMAWIGQRIQEVEAICKQNK